MARKWTLSDDNRWVQFLKQTDAGTLCVRMKSEGYGVFLPMKVLLDGGMGERAILRCLIRAGWPTPEIQSGIFQAQFSIGLEGL